MTRSHVLVLAGLAALAICVTVATNGAPANAARAGTAPPLKSQLGTPQACGTYGGVPAGWPSEPHAGMVQVAAGRFTPGSHAGYPDERPGAEARLRPFWIDRTEVTNAQFLQFVQATGYVTEAERSGGAAVFRAPADGSPQGAWWHFVTGAQWRHPEGPESSIRGRENQPVVQVTRADAVAYARWLGRDLPSEAQWEFAALANGQGERIERGPRDAAGHPTANFWQGSFPYLDVKEDGYAGRAPVGCFPANGLGLHDMIGNAWEWTADRWRGQRQPHGTDEPMGRGDPVARGVIKGGSFLCSPDLCARYRESARFPQDTTLGAAHVGFRTVSPQ